MLEPVTELFFDDGDGDQSYFAEPFYATRVFDDWFNEETIRGLAWLLRVKDGVHADELLVITGRGDSIEHQIDSQLKSTIKTDIYVSVVLHQVICDNNSPGSYRLIAIGMTVAPLERNQL